jgi:hypothetical protein
MGKIPLGERSGRRRITATRTRSRQPVVSVVSPVPIEKSLPLASWASRAWPVRTGTPLAVSP